MVGAIGHVILTAHLADRLGSEAVPELVGGRDDQRSLGSSSAWANADAVLKISFGWRS